VRVVDAAVGRVVVNRAMEEGKVGLGAGGTWRECGQLRLQAVRARKGRRWRVKGYKERKGKKGQKGIEKQWEEKTEESRGKMGGARSGKARGRWPSDPRRKRQARGRRGSGSNPKQGFTTTAITGKPDRNLLFPPPSLPSPLDLAPEWGIRHVKR
jgi:hypothetical protein